ncbi:hypothetical protein FACS1894106_2480 [Spirochaetia bacterium]|nr:hypothetical protein FACS1894106_2480 [Spirochaetia bacterium]
MAKVIPFRQPGQPVSAVDRFAGFVANAATAPAPEFFSLLDDFCEQLDRDGTSARWKAEKEARKQKRRGCRYDRGAIMRAAWQYRKGWGMSMSEALKRAWAGAKEAVGETA